MKGFKVFNPDWTDQGYQFGAGKTFREAVKPECGASGFHFYLKAAECFNDRKFDPNNKIAEVEAVGEVDISSEDAKCSTNRLHIIREVAWNDIFELATSEKSNSGTRNSGDYNSGHRNSGHRNSGHRNSGNRNSGTRNSGDYNSGHRNSGHRNSGHRNSGTRNSGDYNSGHRNSGNRNSGNCNSGDWNSGDYNSGIRNSGDYNRGFNNSGFNNSGLHNSGIRNSGNYNSGHRNSGNRNSGNCNSGDWNSGNYNSGDWNIGDWNKASLSLGCFNTKQQKLRFFDKETDMTLEQWRRSEAWKLINGGELSPVEWIGSEDMTDEEKTAHPEHKVTNGYLKLRDITACCTKWWKGLSDSEKDIIRSIPNYNPDIFFELTGIRDAE